MATYTIETYLQETAAYINEQDRDRAGHHNHVVERNMMNASKAISEMSKSELDKFDSEQLEYIRYLDLQ